MPVLLRLVPDKCSRGTLVDNELLKVKIQVISCVLTHQDLIVEPLRKFGSVNE